MVKAVGDRVKTQEVIAVVDRGLSGRKEYGSPADGVIEEISDLSGRVVIREEFGRENPPVPVDVASELRCRPSEIPQHMLRQVGQEVLQGQMIAPISGIISEINGQTGKVTISRPFKQVEVDAYISGRVTEVLPGQGCVVQTPGIRLNGIFGVGKETCGEIRVVTGGPDETLTAEMIVPELAGKVVVGGSFATNEALSKALERAGLRVRVVSQPYFGAIGIVTHIVKEPEAVETEAMVPVVRVLLQDGREVSIPRANVEVY